LVSKGDLMARVWPHTFVEESNLKVQVAALRRALGDTRGSNRYLATIPGRGYRFVAPVTLSKAPRPPAPERAAGPMHNLLSLWHASWTGRRPWGRSRRNCRTSVS
jgi:DNA-binding winged helix-turn-helix (wHTH) protein